MKPFVFSEVASDSQVGGSGEYPAPPVFSSEAERRRHHRRIRRKYRKPPDHAIICVSGPFSDIPCFDPDTLKTVPSIPTGKPNSGCIVTIRPTFDGGLGVSDDDDDDDADLDEWHIACMSRAEDWGMLEVNVFNPYNGFRKKRVPAGWRHPPCLATCTLPSSASAHPEKCASRSLSCVLYEVRNRWSSDHQPTGLFVTSLSTDEILLRMEEVDRILTIKVVQESGTGDQVVVSSPRVFVSDYGRIVEFDLGSQKPTVPVRSFKDRNDQVLSSIALEYSPDEKVLWGVDGRKFLSAWDVGGGSGSGSGSGVGRGSGDDDQHLLSRVELCKPQSVLFDADSRHYVYVACDAGKINVLDPRMLSEVVLCFQPHKKGQKPVLDIARLDRDRCVSVCCDGTIATWRGSSSGKQLVCCGSCEDDTDLYGVTVVDPISDELSRCGGVFDIDERIGFWIGMRYDAGHRLRVQVDALADESGFCIATFWRI